MDKAKKAVELFESGYNCSQAIVLAFEDYLNVDRKTLQSLSSSFGGGISRLREVCGCVSGMAIIMGIIHGDYDVNDNDQKAKHYELIQKLALKFKEKTNSINCAELLDKVKEVESPTPEVRTKEYYEKRPCSKYIKIMAEIIESELSNHG
ncbi:MAG: C_GCAxxG_C_C family protein [Bacilli bacterium]|nr:C_GCAxxG_C_C family protein [Bacilli bacterium]